MSIFPGYEHNLWFLNTVICVCNMLKNNIVVALVVNKDKDGRYGHCRKINCLTILLQAIKEGN